MRLSGVLYLLGMGLLFLGERLIGGDGVTRWVADGVGILAVLGALYDLFRGMGEASDAHKGAWRTGLIYGIVGLLSVVVYVLSTDAVVAALSFATDETEARYGAVIGAIWPIIWAAGTLPFLAVSRALAVNPKAADPGRVAQQAAGALGLAFAIAALLPVNYLANKTNERWDLGYFKTAQPGTSTAAMVAGMDEPLAIYLFFPVSSDVTDEVRTYFDKLEGGNLTVQYVDQALEPELAKDLKVRDNGYVVLARGEGDDQQVERIKIGTDFDSAKRTLKKLDEEVKKSLLKIARGKKVAYFTVGHGELFWKNQEIPDTRLNNLKKVIEALNYSVKELGMAQGLANEVPEDADVVFVMGPTGEFQPEELAALDRYRNRGGSLFIGLEPSTPDLSVVLGPLGVKANTAVTLAHDATFVPRTYGPVDRGNLVTNKYSTHASVTTLSRNSSSLVSIFAGATSMEEDKGSLAAGGKTTVTVRSLPETWPDADGDYAFDADSEKRGTFDLAIAASGPAPDAKPAEEGGNPPEYRAVVFADATWASDIALALDPSKGNFQLAMDVLSWLGHEGELQGTVNNEEDVKIEHTHEGQGIWFYGTAFILPLGFLLAGIGRIQLRRNRGAK